MGSWKATWTEEFWIFQPDGSLECVGRCYYGQGIGHPQSWEDDPSANLWASEYDYLKLVFSEKVFEGSLGAYRCEIIGEGEGLRLRPFSGPDLDFTKVITE